MLQAHGVLMAALDGRLDAATHAVRTLRVAVDMAVGTHESVQFRRCLLRLCSDMRLWLLVLASKRLSKARQPRRKLLLSVEPEHLGVGRGIREAFADRCGLALALGHPAPFR